MNVNDPKTRDYQRKHNTTPHMEGRYTEDAFKYWQCENVILLNACQLLYMETSYSTAQDVGTGGRIKSHV